MKKETKAVVYDHCDNCEVKKLNALLQQFIMNKADIFGIQFDEKMFYFDKMVEFTHDSEIEKLKEQLAEKDKEIKELEAKLKSQKLATDVYSTIAGSSATKMSIAKKVRHQICEEIRESMCCIYDYKNDEYLNGWNNAMHTVYDKLDQIEQGENDAKN